MFHSLTDLRISSRAILAKCHRQSITAATSSWIKYSSASSHSTFNHRPGSRPSVLSISPPCTTLAFSSPSLSFLHRPLSRMSSSTTTPSTSTASTDVVVERVTPVKSANDHDRHYRYIRLSNGLKALLIHEQESEKAAAALSVNIGHFSDPDELPGLAHFLEHMLFLGTEKYPIENSYSSFLNTHGGHSNAFTSMEETNYYFDVQHSHFEEALDRFAAFFTCPLLSDASSDREVLAVDQENKKNLLNDAWRLFQLSKACADPNHPYHKFGSGSKETLQDIPLTKNIKVHEELKKFHQKWYSSSIMSLAVLGRESLDELEALVVSKFGSVKNLNISSPVFSPTVYKEDALQLFKVVPQKDIRSLALTWPIPSTQSSYLSKPTHLIGHLIGHEGKGSILSYLKKKGWGNSLSGGSIYGNSSFAFMSVQVDLTEEGLLHVDDVIETVYAYLQHVLLPMTEEQWKMVYQEVHDIQEMTFRFKSQAKPISYVQGLASDLHLLQPKDVLSGDYLYQVFDLENIKRYLQPLTASNMRATVISPTFKNQTSLTERWYGTEHSAEAYSPQLLERCAAPKPNSELFLPKPNPFIATDFQIKFKKWESEDERKKNMAPLLLACSDHEMSRLWWKPDHTFLLPKCNAMIKFTTPLVYDSPRASVLAYLFAKHIEENLNEYAYDSQIAGLSYQFYQSAAGLQITISGYNHKLPLLLETILNELTHFQADELVLSRLKDSFQRSLVSFKKEQPTQQAMYDEMNCLEEHLWHHNEKLPEIDSVNTQELTSFAQTVFKQYKLDTFINGNMTDVEARQVYDLVQNKMKGNPLKSSQVPTDRVIQLSPHQTFVRQFVCPNDKEANNATIVTLQLDSIYDSNVLQKLNENNQVTASYEPVSSLPITPVSVNFKLLAISELFANMISEPAFDQLRTKEQLGYIVSARLVSNKNVLALRLIIQSGKASADYLEERIESFLHYFGNVYLPEQADEWFETHKSALINALEEKDKKLTDEFNSLWTEIHSSIYQFNRRDLKAQHVRTCTRQDVMDFFAKHISIQAPQRKKFTTQLFGKDHNIPPQKVHLTEEDFLSNKEINPVQTEESSSTSTAQKVFLPPVPVDPRPRVYVTDYHKFKRMMPLHPSY